MTALLRRIATNLSWLVAGNLLARGALLLLVMVAARGMGPAAVGVLTVALGAAMVAVPFFALGKVELLIREVARSPADARALLAAARRRQRPIVAVALPVLAAAALAIGNGELRATLLALVPYVWLRVEAVTRAAVFTGLDRMGIDTRSRALELVTALALAVGAVVLDLPTWSLGVALSAGAALAVAWLVRQERELPAAAAAPASAAPWSESLPFLGQGVALQLLLRGDTLLLAALAVAAVEIGYYGVATALVWGLLAGAQLVAVALYPTLSRRAAAGRQPASAAMAAGALGLGLGLAAAGALWLFAAPLVRLLFGAGFAPALPLAERLVWALPAASAAMVAGVVTAAWRRQGWGLAVLAGAALLALGLDLQWIPRDGALGAANAAVVAHAAAAVGQLAVAAWPARRAVRTTRPEPDGDRA